MCADCPESWEVKGDSSSPKKFLLPERRTLRRVDFYFSCFQTPKQIKSMSWLNVNGIYDLSHMEDPEESYLLLVTKSFTIREGFSEGLVLRVRALQTAFWLNVICNYFSQIEPEEMVLLCSRVIWTMMVFFTTPVQKPQIPKEKVQMELKFCQKGLASTHLTRAVTPTRMSPQN